MYYNRNEEAVIDEAKDILALHLEENGYNKTNERFLILEEIYRRNDHFDADTLYDYMVNNSYSVSRTTVFSTLELLVKFDLVRRHQFEKKCVRYEKSYGYKQHDHIICEDCGKLVDFCDPRIQEIKDAMGDQLNYKVTTHSLNLYGKCNGACERTNNSEPE